MHVCFVRSAAVTAAMAGTLIWAPTASAQPSEPAPSASAAPAETPAPDTGSVEITAKDTAGGVLPAPCSCCSTPPARKPDAARATPRGS
ncbi:hypothetical protein ACGFZQ_50500 [Streptomyces sp. NPDC048254]|uniref:hypothetical protein n=1 Tax=Streptomyces sp. NPDC048254 TaxID=3365525 RepID=UPI003723DEBA